MRGSYKWGGRNLVDTPKDPNSGTSKTFYLPQSSSHLFGVDFLEPLRGQGQEQGCKDILGSYGILGCKVLHACMVKHI